MAELDQVLLRHLFLRHFWRVEGYLVKDPFHDRVKTAGPDVLGAFVERCMIDLQLPDRDRQRFFFGAFDSLPLGLSRLNAIIDDMYREAIDLAPEGGLPRNYFPEPGDILIRTDGHRFEVIALTSDRKGVELHGLDDPLTIFVAIEALRQQFTGLAERRRFP